MTSVLCLLYCDIDRDQIVARCAQSIACQLVLMHQVDVLLQISTLVETHVTTLVLAAEWFLLSVNTQMSIEFTDAAKDFVAYFFTFIILSSSILEAFFAWNRCRSWWITVRTYSSDRLPRLRFYIVTLVEPEHFFLVVLFEVVNYEVFAVRNMLLFAR